ncbi:MAG: tyrosine recombinase XerC [Tissierellia bacterium]|nr:tyrosine recombinase XerC [Tissierellia bacterium]
MKTHILDDYLNYLSAAKGAAQTTVKEYYYNVREFMRFLRLTKEDLDIDPEDFDQIDIDPVDLDYLRQVSRQDVNNYNIYLSQVRKNSVRTRHRKISCIRSFFDTLSNGMELLEENPALNIELPKIEKKLPTYLTLEEAIHLLNTVDQAKGSALYRTRDYAIITIFLNCGLRLSELSQIDLEDIKDQAALRVLGKGRKERMVYLNRSCQKSIKDYLDCRAENNLTSDELDEKALFLSMRKKRMSPRAIQHMIEKHLKNAGFDTRKYSVHKLRHTAATLIYQYGHSDIRTVQEILGHESVATTNIYTHIDNQDIRQAIFDNPLANPDALKKP